MSGLGIAIALLAGLVSFASPCCLPLVPVYVSYLVGTTEPGSPGARRVALRHALVFVAGFTAVFVALWASVGLVGYVLRDYVGALRLLAGAALVVLGLHVAGLIRISALYREVRVPVGANRRAGAVATVARAGSGGAGTARGAAGARPGPQPPSYGRSALLGVAFAAGWTPCVGPILGGIIGLASVSQSAARGTALLLAYAAGLGIPFVLVAVGATEVHRRFAWFRRHRAGVELATGAMLILVGFLMMTNLFARLSGLLPGFAL